MKRTASNSSSHVHPPSTDDVRLIATAFHESGHAVMALALGRDVHKVSILPAQLQSGGRRLGACELKKGHTKKSRDWVEDEALILYAGMIAESHFTNQRCELGAAQDLRAARRLLQNRVNNERQLERLERRLLDKTEHMLSDESHACAIKAIARELIANEKISGRGVRHLFNQALQQK